MAQPLSTILFTQGDIDRFWNKVAITANDQKCWEWQDYIGAKNKYGLFRKGRLKCKAHRLAYLFYYKTIEDEKLVMHSCDNPSCVNPHHLSLGTPKDNALDKCRKGRRFPTHGEAGRSAKVTTNDVIAIRNLHKWGYKQTHIAEHFKITQAQVSLIIKRIEWKHLEDTEKSETKPIISTQSKPRKSYVQLTDDLVREIKYNTVNTQKELCEKYNVSQGTISGIKLNRYWKHI